MEHGNEQQQHYRRQNAPVRPSLPRVADDLSNVQQTNTITTGTTSTQTTGHQQVYLGSYLSSPQLESEHQCPKLKFCKRAALHREHCRKQKICTLKSSTFGNDRCSDFIVCEHWWRVYIASRTTRLSRTLRRRRTTGGIERWVRAILGRHVWVT